MIKSIRDKKGNVVTESSDNLRSIHCFCTKLYKFIFTLARLVDYTQIL